MAMRTRLKKYLKIIIIILGVYYGIIIFTPLSRWMADRLVVGAAISPADVIIVLSGGTVKQEYLNQHSLSRLVHGIRLWRQGKASNIILSGGPPVSGGVAEAYLLTEMAGDLGVDTSKIIIEDKSINTRENIANCAHIMRQRGWQRALLVTSALHMRRTLKLAEEQGIVCLPAPAPYTERYLSHYQLFQLVKHEYLSSIAHRLFGDKGLRLLVRINQWQRKWRKKAFYY